MNVDVTREARDLIERAQREGSISLPYLTQIDLCALESTRQAVIDADAWARWSGMTPEHRAAYRRLAIEILQERKLVGMPEDAHSDQLPVSAELGLILAARSRPIFVATFSPADLDTARDQPRLYCLADEATESASVLFELPGPRHLGAAGREIDYSLCSLQRGAEVMAHWLTDTESPGRLKNRNTPQAAVVTNQEGSLGGVVLRVHVSGRVERTIVCTATGSPDVKFRLGTPAQADDDAERLRGFIRELFGRLTSGVRQTDDF